MVDIVLGRSKGKLDKFGKRATVLLGKQYVKMLESTPPTIPVYLDVDQAHVVFVCGKRGSGKSYSLGTIAEGIADSDAKDHIAVILIDTMGIYWTMKYPNHKPDEEALLKKWGLEGKGYEQVKVYTPLAAHQRLKTLKTEESIRTDAPLTIRPVELQPEDWCLAFDLPPSDRVGVFIESAIFKLREQNDNYSVVDILEYIRHADESDDVKKQAVTRFESVQQWGVFSDRATPMRELAQAGQITVIDLSYYAELPNGWRVKALVLSLIAQKMFFERMKARKSEEYDAIHSTMHYLLDEHDEPRTMDMPLVWLFIDEAHEFLPITGKTGASDALITLLREGRQPGIAMALATQQPGKIHTDAMTQSDIIISHHLTAKIDTDALGVLFQSYLRQGLDQALRELPRVPGAALVVDDANERMFAVQMRPRVSWHGGAAPAILTEKKKAFDF